MVFHGAVVGAGSRLAAGSVVHTATQLPPGSRVGLRCVAAPAESGAVITSDIEKAREAIAQADFFGRAFALDERDQETLHAAAARMLRAEARAWVDEPAG